MADRPMRIQRRRVRGWRMPLNTVYVGRPSRWGNPFIYLDGEGLHERLFLYRRWLAGLYPPAGDKEFRYLRQRGEKARHSLIQLRGKNLACWCKLCHAHRNGKPMSVECPACDPCHANVLLELANR